MTPAMLFELTTILLLATIGSLMLTAGLPGWGLILSALSLALISLFLRNLKLRQPAMVRSSAGTRSNR